MKAVNIRLNIRWILLVALILTVGNVAFAEDVKIEEDIWAEETGHLSESRAHLIMQEVEEDDPDLAKTLQKLWATDRDGFMELLYEKKLMPSSVKGHVIDEKKLKKDFVAWLQKNFEEEAKNLQAIKENCPDTYERHLALSRQQYNRIMETERKNPELAEVMKQDVRLTKQRGVLLAKISKAKDSERKKLIAELKKIVDARFDIIVKKKQLRYENLEKRIDWLSKKIEENKIETQKLIEKKEEKTKERLAELLSEAEKMNWDK